MECEYFSRHVSSEVTKETVIGSDENGPMLSLEDAKLITTSVNARLKVEELVQAASACVDLAAVGADLGPKTAGAAKIADGDLERFKKALREVKAALKGEA